MSDFIVCPKCDRRAFSKSDIKWKFCPKCGYHDVPDGTPEGIPGVSAKFRQPTPSMQLVADYAGLEGIFHNWQEEITGLSEFAQRFLDFGERLKEIGKRMDETGRADSWDG